MLNPTPFHIILLAKILMRPVVLMLVRKLGLRFVQAVKAESIEVAASPVRGIHHLPPEVLAASAVAGTLGWVVVEGAQVM